MLRQISFFANMRDFDLQQIARIAVVRDYAPGAVIIEELAEGANFYIISHGKIEITKKYGYDDEFVLGVYSDGDFFGEMALLDEGRRSATVRALEPTTLLEISKNDFQLLLRKAPNLAFGILKELSARLRLTGALLVSYLQQRNRRLRAAFTETLRNIARAFDQIRGERAALPRHTTELARLIGIEMNLSTDDLLVLEMRSLLYDLGTGDIKTQDLGTLESLGTEEGGKAREAPPLSAEPPDARPLLEREISHVFHHPDREEEPGLPEDFLGTDSHQISSIIAVADAFSTMIRARPKGQNLKPEAALEVIRTSAEGWFDPDVVRALLRLWESGKVATLR